MPEMNKQEIESMVNSQNANVVQGDQIQHNYYTNSIKVFSIEIDISLLNGKSIEDNFINNLDDVVLNIEKYIRLTQESELKITTTNIINNTLSPLELQNEKIFCKKVKEYIQNELINNVSIFNHKKINWIYLQENYYSYLKMFENLIDYLYDVIRLHIILKDVDISYKISKSLNEMIDDIRQNVKIPTHQGIIYFKHTNEMVNFICKELGFDFNNIEKITKLDVYNNLKNGILNKIILNIKNINDDMI